MSEEQAQELLHQMQMLETYMTDLTQREATLSSVYKEAIASIESLRKLGEKGESDTLIPIGMGTYVKSKISATDRIVLNIGAGVAMEKDKEQAINFLEAKIKEIEVALQDTSAKRQETLARLEQGKQEINRLMQAAAPKN